MNFRYYKQRPFLSRALVFFFCIGLFTFNYGCNSRASSKRQQEKLTAVGWVQNPHAEYLHTVIGFKTTDNHLLNLIFPGVHQQLVDGMYCRITFHRLTDLKQLPEFIRNTKLDYFLLDEVELLPLPSKSKQNQKQKKGELP